MLWKQNCKKATKQHIALLLPLVSGQADLSTLFCEHYIKKEKCHLFRCTETCMWHLQPGISIFLKSNQRQHSSDYGFWDFRGLLRGNSPFSGSVFRSVFVTLIGVPFGFCDPDRGSDECFQTPRSGFRLVLRPRTGVAKPKKTLP